MYHEAELHPEWELKTEPSVINVPKPTTATSNSD